MYFTALAHPGRDSKLRDLFIASRTTHPRAESAAVLLPLDASAASEHAVEYVARNLTGLRARVHVLINPADERAWRRARRRPR